MTVALRKLGMVAAMSIFTAPATSLAERLTGQVITPDHLSYEIARRVWNGMIDKRPAMIARCADADDVATAIRFAAEHGLRVAVRGGGHNVAGTAAVDDGLVIDLSAMRAVRIDDTRRTVHVQGGATWADVDRVTAPLGLATPGGVVSETGVAGLALSGGVSHQRRRDGMTADNLVSAEVVLADGRQVHASADEHSDLYWALRGGGGNFGIVTSFELRLHALGPEVFALHVAYPVEDAARVLSGWRDAVAGAPDELSTEGFIWSLPVVDELPEQLRGLPYVGVAGMWAGDPAEGEHATRRAARAGHPAAGLERAGGLPRLPGLAGPVLPGRPAPLLEGAVPGRLLRRRDRDHGRLVRPPPVERHAGHHPPLRRGDRPRRRRGDRVRRP